MEGIRWEVSREELESIRAIVERAAGLWGEMGETLNRLEVEMDITAVHNNGIALDLAGLLVSSDSDFAHDIAGIRANLDRRTGKLGGCFLPRYTRAEREEEEAQRAYRAAGAVRDDERPRNAGEQADYYGD